MLTAGEALQVKHEEFVRDAVIAGIRDSGKHPPLIVRQWHIDPYRYRDIVKPAYDNLFTMMKHNTEMLVSPYADPRNKTWISFGQSHIINVHLNTDAVALPLGLPAVHPPDGPEMEGDRRQRTAPLSAGFMVVAGDHGPH